MGLALRKSDESKPFTIKYLDDDTGLYYFGARYYDPGLGRFVSADGLFIRSPELCISRPLECNLYGYANNNPIKNVDSTGEWVHIAIGAGIGGIVSAGFEAYSTYRAEGEINWAKTGSAALGGAITGAAVTANPILAAGAGLGGDVVRHPPILLISSRHSRSII